MSHQQSLFDTSTPEWELDAREQRLVASVVLSSGPDRAYDYLVPEAFCDSDRAEQCLEPGRRVQVPFGRGNRTAVGYCVQLETRQVDPGRLKQVAGVVDHVSLLTPAMLRLTRWMADYYLCPWGQVLETVVPAGVRGRAGTRQVTVLRVPEDVRVASQKLPVKQRRALEILAASRQPLTAGQLALEAGCTEAPIRGLLKKGLVTSASVRRATTRPEAKSVARQAPLELNAEQRVALDSIRQALEASEARGILVHGVTGSGKTEIYIQAIEHCVSLAGRRSCWCRRSASPRKRYAGSKPVSIRLPCCTAT